MKKFFKFPLLMAVAVLTTLGFASCDDDDDDKVTELTEQEKRLQTINEAYVDEVIVPTYKMLSDESALLEDAVADLSKDITDANVAKACELWKTSRKYWEWSEAFLIGAAGIEGIDPHIDTWPLNRVTLQKDLLDTNLSQEQMKVKIEGSDMLAGFHGLEYIIFREGKNRPAADITPIEMRYAVAVVEDLVLSCYRLEAYWAGIDNVSGEKKSLLTEENQIPDINYGEHFKKAQKVAGMEEGDWGSIFGVSENLIFGFMDIVDEVGNAKIGSAFTGEDPEYIESPHAYNSIQDFEDNIQGVRYAYFGKMEATSAQSNSIGAYIKEMDATADKAVLDAFDNAIAKIKAMPKPFVLNFTDPRAGEAIEACDDLNTALIAAQKVLRK
ncbi:MAG: peptidase M75 [Tannerella sp.]|jgi:hypothetical protein|nr:peptidase M75 [Tannerella sp.]